MASVMPFDAFLRTSLLKRLLKSYRNFEILSEADLQAFVWMHATRFLRKLSNDPSKFRVCNKLYCGDLGIHPDLAVLRYGKPWICIELKETGRLGKDAIREDWKRLNDTRRKLRAHRGYLIYLVRHGAPHFPKAQDFLKDPAHCLISISISMKDKLPADEFTAWNQKFKRLANFRLQHRRL
jgi:hypothetical protein